MHLYDIAEEDIKNDKLGYQNYVEELYQLIKQAFEDNKSLNIGIAGSWGDGKTTSISMCLAKLKKHFTWYKRLNWRFIIPVSVISLFTLWLYSNELRNLFILFIYNPIMQIIFLIYLEIFYCDYINSVNAS